MTPDELMDRAHVVIVTDRRIDCVDGCGAFDPHIHEYRALDVNPTTTTEPEGDEPK